MISQFNGCKRCDCCHCPFFSVIRRTDNFRILSVNKSWRLHLCILSLLSQYSSSSWRNGTCLWGDIQLKFSMVVGHMNLASILFFSIFGHTDLGFVLSMLVGGLIQVYCPYNVTDAETAGVMAHTSVFSWVIGIHIWFNLLMAFEDINLSSMPFFSVIGRKNRFRICLSKVSWRIVSCLFLVMCLIQRPLEQYHIIASYMSLSVLINLWFRHSVPVGNI